MECRLTVEYVSLSPEQEVQWWAAMRWIGEKMKSMRERKYHWIGEPVVVS